jgi:hypothetical protein
MATADMITISNVEEYVPDIRDYGILNFNDLFEKSRQDIFRALRIEWWPRRAYGLAEVDISQLADPIEMDETKLTESQFTRASVYHCLGYYIFPQLSRHDPETDRFYNMMNFYRAEYAREWTDILKDGIEYDDDGDGSITDSEKISVHYQRLVR